MKFKTKVNFFAPPGSGKSTTAAGTFHLMKLLGLNVELVTEFAKDMVWAGRHKEMVDHCYITAKQFHKMHRLVGQVDWIVTDSPLLLGLIYKSDDYFEHYDKFLIEQFSAFDNCNILLKRVKPFNPKGRLQNEKESDALKDSFNDLLTNLNVPYYLMDGDEDAPQNVLDILKQEKLLF